MGWFEVLWIIVGSICAICCLIASISYFADNRPGAGIGMLLLTPVAFVAGTILAFLAVLVAIGWLIMAALSY